MISEALKGGNRAGHVREQAQGGKRQATGWH